MTKKVTNTIWGGRFETNPDALMQQINASIGFDQRLAHQDIKASQAHTEMLKTTNVIDNKDADAIQQGLFTILSEINAGAFDFSETFEDIHMNVEARLKELIGTSAGRLHTARSRNDQVATDFRLWIRDGLDTVQETLKKLISALLNQAEKGADWPMPGFTHLQVAQPVTWGHHMMAYVEMFGRDLSRAKDARNRMNECPLGSAALAGTSFPIDRNETTKALGFTCPTANSIDSVSDRDFALEFLALAAISATHLSRLAEEIVIWSSAQFKFVTLSDRFATGSSIMPQKKNPDAAELVRAKSGRIFGAMIALFTVMKGLVLAYSKDMQEDKEQVFDAYDSLIISLNVMTGLLDDIDANPEILLDASKAGFSTATDLADWLVQKLNLPFREAHHITGQIVRVAEKKKCTLDQLTIKDMQNIHKAINSDIYSVLSVENSIASRTSYGGTAPKQVRAQIARWRKFIT